MIDSPGDVIAVVLICGGLGWWVGMETAESSMKNKCDNSVQVSLQGKWYDCTPRLERK